MADFFNLSSLILGVFIFGVSFYWWHNKRKLNLPPGPWCLPFVGYLPFLGKEPYKVLKELSEVYGNIFSLYFGTSYTVVLNDFESVKEAFSNNALIDRPPKLFDFLPDGLGFTGKNGAEWMEQRRYSMRTLKDIGMSKNPWEMDLEVEIEDFVKLLEKEGGKPVDISKPLLSSASNSMTSIVLGKRLHQGDPRRAVVDQGINAVIQTFTQGNLVTVFPDLMKTIAQLGLTKFASLYKKLESFNALFRKEIEFRKKVSPDQSEDIYIDGYLKEIAKAKENNANTFFNDNNLIGSAQALIVGGSETSKTVLVWLFLAMATYPDVQDKVQDEIDRVLGRDGKLQWMERAKLPYTYAVTMEILRWRTTTPLGAFHRASTDTKIQNFDIPKGTNIVANIWAMHKDPKYWKDPESFIPERFLDKEGNLVTNRLHSYLPFSIGRRNCPGEIVAVIEVFRYFTSIMQKFDIRRSGDTPLNLSGLYFATFQSIPQKLRYIPRE